MGIETILLGIMSGIGGVLVGWNSNGWGLIGLVISIVAICIGADSACLS